MLGRRLEPEHLAQAPYKRQETPHPLLSASRFIDAIMNESHYRVAVFEVSRSLNRYRLLREFLGPEVWNLFRIAIAIGILWFFVETSFVLIIQGFLTTLGLINSPPPLISRVFPSSIGPATALFIAYGAFRALALSLKLYFSFTTHQTFIRSQRTRLMSFFLLDANKISMSRALNIFNERVQQGAAVTIALLHTIISFTTLIFFLLFALWLAPRELGIGLALLGIFLWPLRLFNSAVARSSHGVTREGRLVTQSLVVGLKNMFLLRLYDAAGAEVQRGTDSLRRHEAHFKTWCRSLALKGASPHFFGIVCMAIIALIGLRYIESEPAALLSFFYIFFRIAQTAGDLNSHVNEVRLNLDGFKDFYRFHRDEMISQADSRLRPSTLMINRPPLIKLEVTGASFAYPQSPPLFEDISFQTRRGDAFLIQGESGSGKSTLLSMLTGLLMPTHGKIRFDDVPLDSIDPTWLRQSIGYVGPESYILEASIRENLHFGTAQPPSDQDCIEALERAGLGSDYRSWQYGLDHVLKDASELSTGQKQRLAFARALLRKPRILILDEATANLDRESEARIVATLAELRSQFMILIVSHRAEPFERLVSDRISLKGNRR